MNALTESIQTWWRGLTLREQRMLSLCILLVIVGSAYWGAIQPLSERSERANTRINSEKQLLQWVSNKADKIVELRASEGVSYSNQPFNQVISSSAKQYRIELIRIQPRDEMLQVWVKPIKFEQLVHWLAYLQQKQGIHVEFMDIASDDVKGVVQVKRLQLRRGA